MNVNNPPIVKRTSFYLSKSNIIVTVALLTISLLGMGLALGTLLQLLPGAALLAGEVTSVLAACSLSIYILAISCRNANKGQEIEVLKADTQNDKRAVSSSRRVENSKYPSTPHEFSAARNRQPHLDVQPITSHFIQIALPDEIIFAIFSFLEPTSSSLRDVSLVCREWRVVSTDESLWRRVFMHTWPGRSPINYSRNSEWKLKCTELLKGELKSPPHIERGGKVDIRGEILFKSSHSYNQLELWDLVEGTKIKTIGDNISNYISNYKIWQDNLITLHKNNNIEMININTKEICEIYSGGLLNIEIKGHHLFFISNSPDPLKIFNLKEKRFEKNQLISTQLQGKSLHHLAVKGKFLAVSQLLDYRYCIHVWNRENSQYYKLTPNRSGSHNLYIYKDILIYEMTLNGALFFWELNSYFKRIKVLRKGTPEKIVSCSTMNKGRLALCLVDRKTNKYVVEIWSLISFKLCYTQPLDENVNSIALQKDLLICNGSKAIYRLPKLRD